MVVVVAHELGVVRIDLGSIGRWRLLGIGVVAHELGMVRIGLGSIGRWRLLGIGKGAIGSPRNTPRSLLPRVHTKRHSKPGGQKDDR